MKPCADCKNPAACAKAGKCAAAPMAMPKNGKGKIPADKKKSGRFYISQ